MERLRSRTKSMMVFMDGPRKSIVERALKPEPIDPNIAAGGLAPCPAARAKIAMLPTASSMPSTGEGLSGIFASKDVGNTFAESMSRAPPLHGRRSISALSMSPNHDGDGDGQQQPRSASAMEGGGGDNTPQLPWLSEPTHAKKYKQHTVNEYHRVMNEFQQIKWGGLGADDNDEKRKARAIRQRVLDYGKCVSQLNVQVIKQSAPEDHRHIGAGGGIVGSSSSQPIPRKLTKEGELAKLKRERALQFADQLWVRPDGQPAHGNGRKSVELSPAPASQSPARRGNPNQVMIPGPLLVEELHALEGRHREDYERILSIKRQLGIQKAALPPISLSQEMPARVENAQRDDEIDRTTMDGEQQSQSDANSGKLPAFLREDYREEEDTQEDVDDVMYEVASPPSEVPQQQQQYDNHAIEQQELVLQSTSNSASLENLSRHSSTRHQQPHSSSSSPINNKGSHQGSQHMSRGPSPQSPLQREASSIGGGNIYGSITVVSNDRQHDEGNHSPPTSTAPIAARASNERSSTHSSPHPESNELLQGNNERVADVHGEGLVVEASNGSSPARGHDQQLTTTASVDVVEVCPVDVNTPTAKGDHQQEGVMVAADHDVEQQEGGDRSHGAFEATSPALSHASRSSANYLQPEQ
ncbi:Hypothetical protein, putative [Bodo saltans]|uniref:Uncharacterized protein n=1 Tax=Bodo saltans TaxID=75058 RepID=A0A0S4JW14_BODSA|nr:Hypothetical protein, putative [Bodo saltans]|eukprot:CUG93643.1 Hypothetical protein, putative [Bodo saltans]